VEGSRRRPPWKRTRQAVPRRGVRTHPVEAVPKESFGGWIPIPLRGASGDEPRSGSRRKAPGSRPYSPKRKRPGGRRNSGEPRALRSGTPPKRCSRRRLRETPTETPARRSPREPSSDEPGAVPSLGSPRWRHPERWLPEEDSSGLERPRAGTRCRKLHTAQPNWVASGGGSRRQCGFVSTDIFTSTRVPTGSCRTRHGHCVATATMT
jgi:hypothetical protein